MDINNFDQWINTLSAALDKAKAVGMSDQQINDSAVMLGNLLAENVNPDVPENKVIKALWEQGTEQEKQALASMMVKLVQSYKHTKH